VRGGGGGEGGGGGGGEGEGGAGGGGRGGGGGGEGKKDEVEEYVGQVLGEVEEERGRRERVGARLKTDAVCVGGRG